MEDSLNLASKQYSERKISSEAIQSEQDQKTKPLQVLINKLNRKIQTLLRQTNGKIVSLSSKVEILPADLILRQQLNSLSGNWVRKIAEYPATPPLVLRYLALHDDPDVRAAVAENTNTPEEVLLFLASDVNPDIRYMLAENHNLALELLERLIDDENPYVSCRARKTVDRLIRGSVILDVPCYYQPVEQRAFGG